MIDQQSGTGYSNEIHRGYLVFNAPLADLLSRSKTVRRLRIVIALTHLSELQASCQKEERRAIYVNDIYIE